MKEKLFYLEQKICMSFPHTCKYGSLTKIYDETISTGIINEVKPHTTTLMYKMGIPIYFSICSQTSIKITIKEDLNLFEGYILMKEHGRRVLENNEK